MHLPVGGVGTEALRNIRAITHADVCKVQFIVFFNPTVFDLC